MLVVLLVGQFMALLDTSVVYVAAPTIGRALPASGAALQLVVGGYTVCYAMLLITSARLGDLYGRRRMFLLGTIIFTVSSLACGIAPTSALLIGFRFVQGAGAALIVPQIMSVIQTHFGGPARAKALSAYTAVLSAGSVIGLTLGGIIVHADLFGMSWRAVFLVNVPIGVALLALVPSLLPADRPGAGRRVDIRGLTIAVGAVFLVVLPLVLGHETGWPAWNFGSIACGVVLAGVFVALERRLARRGGDPLLTLDVVRAPGMTSGLATMFGMAVTLGAIQFVVTLHLQAGLGEDARHAGLTLVPLAAAFGLVSFYWRKLPGRTHHVLPVLGMALCAVGYAGIAVDAHGGSVGPPLLLGLAVAGVGMGLTVSPLLTLSLVGVPPRQVADASGLVTTTMQLSQVMGVAVFGTVFFSAQPSGPAASSAALSTTTGWLVVVAVVAGAGAIALSRAVQRARRRAAEAVPTVEPV